MIAHDRARELAASELDFALSEWDRDELRLHLDECPACRAFADELRADGLAIADLPSEDAPDRLRDRTLAASGYSEAHDGTESLATTSGGGSGPIVAFPTRYRWPALVAAAAAVIVAVIGGTLAWQSAPTLSDGAIAGRPTPSANGSAPNGSLEPGGSPTAPIDQPLVASTSPVVAELTAADARGGVLALGSSFRLASLDGTPVSELAKRLTVEPEIELVVAPDPDGRAARLTPREPLTPGAVYRFTLAGTGGETLDSWAFQASQPVRVVSTLPEDTQTDVPLDTGIEITFDQDGVTDAAPHVTIEPAIDGRFEQHGRVLAFVPDRRLQPATVYTVSVTRGITVGSTGEAMEQDVRFQFETAAEGQPGTRPVTFQFADDLFESATADRPIVSVWAFIDWDEDDGGEQPEPPESMELEIYRFADLDHAIDGFRQIRGFPRWAQWATDDLVPTTRLTKVATLDARLQDYRGTLWASLPEALPAGWYLVQHPSPARPIQAILQVTDIASYAAVSDTRTLLWTNDLVTDSALAGSAVAAEGMDVGRTGADGTLLFETPPSIVAAFDGSCPDPCAPVMTVRANGQEAFVPATGKRDPDGKDTGGSYVEGCCGDDGYWSAFHTDRRSYRRTDTVNVWGVVRDRDTGRVPDRVTVQLLVGEDDEGSPVALLTRRSRPNASGTFTGSFDLEDVPEGYYEVRVSVDGKVIDSTAISVERILKPAYRLEITTGRRVYFAGDRIRATAQASFFEGTPVPGLALRFGEYTEKSARTDETGTAVVRTVARVAEDEEDGERHVESIMVRPRSAEEGNIEGASREFVVFPSSLTIQGDAEIRSGRVRVTGAVNAVDRERLEEELAQGGSVWELDPRGKPIRGTTVIATFTRIDLIRRQAGTEYDFIEKRVVPVYDYDERESVAGKVRVNSDAKGRFTASVPAAGEADDLYRVTISVTDPDRHTTRSTSWATADHDPENSGPASARLELTSAESSETPYFGVGETVDVTMHDPTAESSGGSRHLFYVAQRGIRSATVIGSPRFTTTFAAWAPPNISVGGVRFTGDGYVEAAGLQAYFRQSDRAITVGLSTNTTRYRPGAEVTVRVRTRDSEGRAVPASVVMRAVDVKLFTISGAEAVDPLADLYQSVGSGILETYASHRTPSRRDDGSGDTGGGGEDRVAFRDVLLFKKVETGSDGRATVRFRLSDDLTSWRLSASAIGADLQAGEGTIDIPVGLPFFVEASIAPEFLVSDRPRIQLRSFGSALEANGRVTYSVDSDSLGLHLDGIRGDAFEAVAVALPKLTLGTHRVTITGRTGSGEAARRDRLTRTFSVVSSRLSRSRTSYQEATGPTQPNGGEGLNEVIVTDASAGRYLPLLLDLAGLESGRLERALAADIAASLVADRFGGAETDATSEPFDGGAYQTADGGLAILPYSASDLEVSSLAAIAAPDRFDRSRLTAYLRAIADSGAETRERRVYALAGLGGLGASVLPDLRENAADDELTIRERLMVGLGAAALGDHATARSIAGSLIERYGEGVGDQARLRVGEDGSDVTAATSTMAVLAAWIGEPLAPRFWAYVEANPSSEATHDLHAAGYIDRVLERQAPEAATFSYRIGDDRKRVELEPGDSLRLTLTEKQLARLSIEPGSGPIGITTSWRAPVKASALQKDPDITIRRTSKPSGTVAAADLVVVDLLVRFGPRAPASCHRVSELVPSGLIPVGHLAGWASDEGEMPSSNVTYPYEQAGQRVTFCAQPTKGDRTVRLRYVARVVTPGSYSWEPAIVESRTAANHAAVTSAGTITIR